MMSEEAASVRSNLRGASNSNPNPNPNPNSAKRKRSQPGTPDPDAEVIALSPKSLMATNRFICEVCNKGFQRDQNLQLHRRGHNLPWKLKQRASQEVVRKKVYVCPEKSCVHHDPSRALGDLTGIKKHFSRKHGEKKWKCDKCSKKYAVQSDWKAHSKICGTREYRCDCGTLFSRKDSFLTHRAFCEALAERSARIASVPAVLPNFGNNLLMNAQAQAAQSLHGFHPEFGGPAGHEALMGNFADGQKLRALPLWLDQANNNNPQLNALSVQSVFSSGANSSCTLPDLTFGSSPQGQWVNCRYPEASFTSGAPAPLSMHAMPQGLKLEPEENKVGGLSHSVSPLYPHGGPTLTHMSMESTRINGNAAFNNSNNNVFGLLGSNLSSTSSHINRMSNVVEIQKLFKQPNQSGNLNDMVNSSQASTNVPQPPIMGKQLHASSNNEDQLSLTRDFLGVGDDSLNRPFLQQELAKFNPIGPAMNLQSQFGGHY